MNELVSIVEDEEDIRKLLCFHLKKSGFRTNEFSDGSSFLQGIASHSPDMVILDLMLPDSDGLELCRFLRSREEYKRILIIMVTAKDTELDKVLGLELGADDYVTKPFSTKELIARVKALLRRRQNESEQKEKATVIEVNDLIRIDRERYEVSVQGAKIDLTSTEFRILELLASHDGRVFSRDNILDYLWGNEKAVVDRTVDVHIKNLREKLGPAKEIIKNVRGIGYKLEK
ncbi:MAG: response regulator transcription factor [Deltaproteobacteria bacterium]|nr:response regulator transcription factor [Deltaproteobacteria bacterium]